MSSVFEKKGCSFGFSPIVRPSRFDHSLTETGVDSYNNLIGRLDGGKFKVTCPLL